MTEQEKVIKHRESVKAHNAANVWQFKCAFNKNTDIDIINHLKSQDNKQGYIKRLILDDIGKGAENDT